MTQPTQALREPAHRVEARAKTLWRIPPLAIGIPVTLIALLVALAAPEARWPAALVTVAALLTTLFFAVVVPAWRYRFHRWEVTPDAIYTQAGWFTRESVIIPVARIQVVDTEAGPLEQLLRLATLTVTTASSAGMIKIVGLDAEGAKQIAADLTTATQAHPGDAT
ncbi:MAG: PH domain-containing protein [Gordonia sp. (in: high G+C Gram-positive bacteria)]|uniref:PH domain-containing protein n=1 Tax=Gordonia sp. (in: high G+C Gram-positive bacteria) TaxID=84139 RepID=UPI0039E5FD73